MGLALMCQPLGTTDCEIHFTTQEQLFPYLSLGRPCAVGLYGTSELQAHQVIVVPVGHPDGLSPNHARRIGEAIRWSYGGTRNLQDYRGRYRQRTPHCQQCAPGRDVDCRRKFQRIRSIVVLRPDKNGNGQLQPRPFTDIFPVWPIRHPHYLPINSFNYLKTSILVAKLSELPSVAPILGGTALPVRNLPNQARCSFRFKSDHKSN